MDSSTIIANQELPERPDSAKVKSCTQHTMSYDVSRFRVNGNTMIHDVDTTVTQTDLPQLYWAGRLTDYAVVYRLLRNQLGGGFGDQNKYPYAWGVLVYVDGLPTRVISSRGLDREWTSLDRLERWLREQGFRYWWVRNELEPLGLSAGDGFSLPPTGIK